MGYDEDDWRLQSNKALADEVKRKMPGCREPGCLVCAETAAFMVVLRERLGVE